jgi:nucleotide-binding universal stress UspA family protein
MIERRLAQHPDIGRENSMNLQKLLIPLDGSRMAEAALPYAGVFSRATGAELYLLGVADTTREAILSPGPTTIAWLLSRERERLQSYLQTTAAALRCGEVSCVPLVEEGNPPDEILAAADRLDADAIFMATHGRGVVARWIIGSVANAIIRRSSRPVLAVQPAPEGQPEQQPISLRRIMVPLDGSQLAEAALPLAADLARATGALLMLVRVEPNIYLHGGYEFVPDFEYPTARTRATVQTYLARVGEAFAADVQHEVTVLRGSPDDELHRFAGEHGVDLTVMTTHGYGGLRRLVIGSTSDRLVRSGLPILLVPPATIPAMAAPAGSAVQAVR